MPDEGSRDASWEQDAFALLDDLESQASAEFAAEREAELADRSRSEYRQVTLASRLMASVGRDVVLGVAGAGLVRGTLERAGAGWLLIGAPDREWTVRTEAVGALTGAAERAVPEVAWEAVARLGLGSALRRLADDGERCLVYLVDGTRHEGELRRVGADFVEVYDEGRLTLVAFEALAAVQSRRK